MLRRRVPIWTTQIESALKQYTGAGAEKQRKPNHPPGSFFDTELFSQPVSAHSSSTVSIVSPSFFGFLSSMTAAPTSPYLIQTLKLKDPPHCRHPKKGLPALELPTPDSLCTLLHAFEHG